MLWIIGNGMCACVCVDMSAYLICFICVYMQYDILVMNHGNTDYEGSHFLIEVLSKASGTYCVPGLWLSILVSVFHIFHKVSRIIMK